MQDDQHNTRNDKRDEQHARCIAEARVFLRDARKNKASALKVWQLEAAELHVKMADLQIKAAIAELFADLRSESELVDDADAAPFVADRLRALAKMLDKVHAVRMAGGER